MCTYKQRLYKSQNHWIHTMQADVDWAECLIILQVSVSQRGSIEEHQMQRPADSPHKHVRVRQRWDKNTSQNTLFKNSVSRSHFQQNRSSIFTAQRTDLYNIWQHVRVQKPPDICVNALTRDQMELRLTNDENSKPNTDISLCKILIPVCFYKADFIKIFLSCH